MAAAATGGLRKTHEEEQEGQEQEQEQVAVVMVEETRVGGVVTLTPAESVRDQENDFAKRLVESAQLLAHHELSQLEELAQLLTERVDGNYL